MHNLKTSNEDILLFVNNILYQPLFQEAPVGLLLVDWKEDKGRILGSNHAMEEFLGYTRQELLNKKFQDFTHRDDIGPDVEQAEKIQKFSMIKRYLRKDDKVVWVKLTANPIYDRDHNFLFYLSWVEKLPNGGHFKVEQDNKGDLYVRPQVKLGNFLQDNWRSIMVLSLILMGYIEKEQVFQIVTKFFLP